MRWTGTGRWGWRENRSYVLDARPRPDDPESRADGMEDDNRPPTPSSGSRAAALGSPASARRERPTGSPSRPRSDGWDLIGTTSRRGSPHRRPAFARMMVSLTEEAQAIDWCERRTSVEQDENGQGQSWRTRRRSSSTSAWIWSS